MSEEVSHEKVKVQLPDLRVFVDGVEIHLSLQQLKLLMIFLYEPSRRISVGELHRRMDLSPGGNARTKDGALRTLITILRQKLNQEYIFTWSGSYSFCANVIREE